MSARFDDELARWSRAELLLAAVILRELESEPGATPMARAVADVIRTTADHLREVAAVREVRHDP